MYCIDSPNWYGTQKQFTQSITEIAKVPNFKVVRGVYAIVAATTVAVYKYGTKTLSHRQVIFGKTNRRKMAHQERGGRPNKEKCK